MCNCDCELTKEERWRQVREEALRSIGVDAIALPATGSFLALDGVAHRVVEYERTERVENTVGYNVWVNEYE